MRRRDGDRTEGVYVKIPAPDKRRGEIRRRIERHHEARELAAILADEWSGSET